jgi:hypothetical protein
VLDEDLRAYFARHRVTRGNGTLTAPAPELEIRFTAIAARHRAD